MFKIKFKLHLNIEKTEVSLRGCPYNTQLLMMVCKFWISVVIVRHADWEMYNLLQRTTESVCQIFMEYIMYQEPGLPKSQN